MQNKKFSIGNVIIILFLIVICAICLFPVLHILAKSFSGENAIISGDVGIIPKDFQIGTYKYVVQDKSFWTAMLNSIVLTIVGTLLSLFFTALTAFPLSIQGLKGRKILLWIFIFVWVSVPSLVPMYITIQMYGLMDTLWALILQDLIIIYNMLIVKSFFESLPKALYEAAVIDGCSRIRYFFAIAIPLSKAVFATVGIFYVFWYWNMYVQPRIYLNSAENKTLQLYLYDTMAMSMSDNSNKIQLVTMFENLQPDAIRCVTIVLAMLPVACLYPFLQKYFTKGVMLGAVKE